MKTCLLFPGQGSQGIGMGKDWYDKSDIVRQYFKITDDILTKDFNFEKKLSYLCFNGPDEVLNETRVCQPALFVVGYSIFKHLLYNNVIKYDDIVLATGISLGALTALACADSLPFESFLKLIIKRSTLMQLACDEQKGGMLALIGGTEAAIKSICKEFDLEISIKNCPGQTVIAGPYENILNAKKVAVDHGFKMAIQLKVAGAYHSRLMQSARTNFENFLKTIKFNELKFPVVSNTIGKPINDVFEIKNALGRQITQTVLFEDCLRFCCKTGFDVGLECGPGNVIAGLTKRIDSSVLIKSAAIYFDKF